GEAGAGGLAGQHPWFGGGHDCAGSLLSAADAAPASGASRSRAISSASCRTSRSACSASAASVDSTTCSPCLAPRLIRARMLAGSTGSAPGRPMRIPTPRFAASAAAPATAAAGRACKPTREPTVTSSWNVVPAMVIPSSLTSPVLVWLPVLVTDRCGSSWCATSHRRSPRRLDGHLDRAAVGHGLDRLQHALQRQPVRDQVGDRELATGDQLQLALVVRR